jgi:putative glutamine amidotransferase
LLRKENGGIELKYAIATARECIDDYGRVSFCFEDLYQKYFLRFNYVLHVVTTPKAFDLFEQIVPSMILLTGGGSVPFEYYNEYGIESKQQAQRDMFEKQLIAYALERDIPVIGICRGMQMINGFLGGKLRRNKGSIHPAGEDHTVHIVGDIPPMVVNSFHNDIIESASLSRVLEAIAMDDRNLHIEAFKGIKNKVLGLQWHPERLPDGSVGKKVSDSLIDQFLNNGTT